MKLPISNTINQCLTSNIWKLSSMGFNLSPNVLYVGIRDSGSLFYLKHAKNFGEFNAISSDTLNNNTLINALRKLPIAYCEADKLGIIDNE